MTGGYLAEPVGARRAGAGVVVAHQIFGVTADVRAVADRLAGLGFTTIAPDFYHRAGSDIELRADDAGRRRGLELFGNLTRDSVAADIDNAIQVLKGHGCKRIGLVGLSAGGHMVYYAATRFDVALTVVLYAGWLTGTDIALSRPEPTVALTPSISGRVVFLVGEHDHLVPPDQRAVIAQRLRVQGLRHEFVEIPDAGHAFLTEGAPTFHPEAADFAWRTIEFETTRALSVGSATYQSSEFR